jgi:hypothetical protein
MQLTKSKKRVTAGNVANKSARISQENVDPSEDDSLHNAQGKRFLSSYYGFI